MPNETSSDSGVAAPHHQAAANLSALIESTEDLIWSIDLDFALLTFNSALQRHVQRYFGTLAAVGSRPEDLLPPDRAAIWPPLFQRALSEGPFRTEISFPGGRVVEVSFNPIILDGKATGLSMFGKDVTERKATESALKEAESRYRAIFDGALEGMFQIQLDGKPLVVNCALARMLGYESPEEFFSHVDKVADEIWSDPNDREKLLRLMDEQEAARGVECQFRRRDGAILWVSLSCRKVRGPDGQPAYLEGFFEDITERKMAELQLRENEFILTEAETFGSLGSYDLDVTTGSWTSSNVLDDLFGIDKKYDRSVASWIALIHHEDRAMMADYFANEVVGKRKAFDKEYRIVRINDKSERWMHGMGKLDFDAQGQPLRMRGVIRDITEQKRAHMQLRESEERYRTAFQTTIDAININRMDNGTYVDCNKAFLDTIGFSRDEVIGRTSLELGIWANRADRERMVEVVRRNSIFRDLEAQFRKKNGELFWGLMSASQIEIGGVPCVLTITRDISAAKAAERHLTAAAEALRVSEERYRMVFQTSLDPILINRTSDRRFIDVNQAFLDTMGFERDDVIGRTSLDLKLWADPRDLETVDELLKKNRECRNVEIQFRKKNGETLWGLMSASVIEIDEVQCVLTITRDISSAKAAEDEIRNLAYYDPLTALPNRRLLLERLRQALATDSRTGHLRALLFVDLDNFKTLNDTLGHQTGDMLLQEAARRLSACIRDTDTVGRLGGDEFVVMLEHLSENPEEAAAQARTVGEKILTTITEPYLLDGRECRSSASIGISLFGDRRESFNEVLQQADIAMYQAKAAGRNTVRFFAPAVQAAVNARAAMEEELRLGLEAGQFVLYYQPQIDRDLLIGAEALIRWNHPWRDILAPGEFIPLAEETGLILPMGKWVLEAACMQIAEWAQHEQSADLSISVNISARQFRQPEFVEQVLSALHRSGASPANLGLELTESILVENIEEVIEKMTELKSHGLKFSLDDFGTGYSSLSYLKRMPLDQLKIDRSFIRDILVDESSAAIAQTIISLSRAMALPVIAEGVETEEQREFLIRNGCHAFQGYLFGRALPLNEFEKQWLPSPKAPIPAAR